MHPPASPLLKQLSAEENGGLTNHLLKITIINIVHATVKAPNDAFYQKRWKYQYSHFCK